MDSLLNTIGNNALLINVVALIVYQFLKPEKTPFATALFAVILIGVVHGLYQSFLEGFYGIEEYKTAIRWAFYLGFAVTDILLVVITVKYCAFKNLAIDKVTRFILISYLAQSANHLIRFVERFWFETDILRKVYPNIVLTLTIGVSIVVVGYVALQFLNEFKTKAIEKD